jgi:FkbM family methyltransferase
MTDNSSVTPSPLLPQHLGLVRAKHGTFLYPRFDRYVGRSLEAYGQFSEGEATLFRHVMPVGGLAVEVGSNIGALTVPLAQTAGPGGKIYAFEPQRPLFQILCANLALNSLFNVEARPLGIGRAPGTLQTPPQDYTAPQNFGGISLTAGPGETVEIVPLDALAFPRLDFLKIDVEGMEAEVLAGAEKTIATHRPVICVENDRDDNSPTLIGLLLKWNYRLWWHIAMLYEADNFRGNPENLFGIAASINMLAVPRERATDLALPEICTPTNRWQDTFGKSG